MNNQQNVFNATQSRINIIKHNYMEKCGRRPLMFDQY